MKKRIKRLLLLLFLLAATPAHGAIARVNSASLGDNAAAATIAAPATSHTAGNLLVVYIAWAGTTVTVTGITDTAGNTYSQCTGALASDVNAGRSDLWFAKNIAGNASNVVTVTFSASIDFRRIAVFQYSGADTVSPFEVAVNTSGTGTSLTSPSFSPAASGNVNVAGGDQSASGNTWTAGANYTLGPLPGSSYTEDRIAAPAGAQTASITNSAAITILMSLASFKAAGGGGGAPPSQLPTMGCCAFAGDIGGSLFSQTLTALADWIPCGTDSTCSTFYRVCDTPLHCMDFLPGPHNLEIFVVKRIGTTETAHSLGTAAFTVTSQ